MYTYVHIRADIRSVSIRSNIKEGFRLNRSLGVHIQMKISTLQFLSLYPLYAASTKVVCQNATRISLELIHI